MSLYSKYKPERKRRKLWWKIFIVFAVCVLILLTIGVALPKKNINTGITTPMWIFYTVSTVLFSQIIYSLFSLVGYIPLLFKRKRWNTGLWIGLPMGVMVFSMMWWGALVGRRQIQVENVEISSPKIPEGFDGYKIAQISDLHLGTWGNDTSFISKLVDRVNSLHPDLIVFTGDAVNRESSEFLPFIKTLKRLNAPDGVLTILGNHDYGDYMYWPSQEAKKANLDSLKSYEKKSGWEMLDNAHKDVTRGKDNIIVIGVGNWGEPPFSKYGSLTEAYPAEKLNDDNYKILLSHNPEHWRQEVTDKTNIDLTLAGHTHAMQMIFSFGKYRWSPSQYRYPNWAGLYNFEGAKGIDSNLYVNIGAGEVGIPMRLGAPSEITIITLRRRQ